jgi:hypothetical protein
MFIELRNREDNTPIFFNVSHIIDVRIEEKRSEEGYDQKRIVKTIHGSYAVRESYHEIKTLILKVL